MFAQVGMLFRQIVLLRPKIRQWTEPKSDIVFKFDMLRYT